MRVVQRGDRSCLTLEAIVKLHRRNLDGHCSVETSVGSAEDFPHSSASDLLLYPVGTQLRAGAQRRGSFQQAVMFFPSGTIQRKAVRCGVCVLGQNSGDCRAQLRINTL